MTLDRNLNCLILAGEKSGEEHALGVWQAMQQQNPELMKECHFWGVGGAQLRALGVETLFDINDFSSMGFGEVVGKIPFYWRAKKKLMQEVKRRQCKVAWLIDFQDFNLRLAKALERQGVKVLYYVAPQAWAWRAHRAQVLAKYVHRLFTILPFERAWFSTHGMPAEKIVYVGHPLSARLGTQSIKRELAGIPQRLLILPGSRRTEIKNHLPIYCQAVKKLKSRYPQLEVHLVKAEHLAPELFCQVLDQSQYEVIDHWWPEEKLSQALSHCQLALATSGTITLITGLFALPTVVCYRTSLFNEWVFQTFVRYAGAVSLTNLVVGRPVFPELLQESMSPDNIVANLDKFMVDRAQYNDVVSAVSSMRDLLRSRADQFAACFEQVMLENYGQRL